MSLIAESLKTNFYSVLRLLSQFSKFFLLFELRLDLLVPVSAFLLLFLLLQDASMLLFLDAVFSMLSMTLSITVLGSVEAE